MADRRSWPLLLAIATLVVISSLTVSKRHRIEWVDHTSDVITKSQLFLAALTDAETGQLGFVVTGDERYLEPYRRALPALAGHLASLRSLTADNPAQERRLDRLGALTRDKLSETAESVRVRRDQGQEVAQLAIRSDRGRLAMESARSLAAEIEAEEYRLLKSRVRQRRESLILLSFFASAGAVFGLVLIFISMRSKLRAQKMLRESESQFRTLADGIPQLCWMANGDGWIFWYNQRWYDYTGTTPEQMAGLGWQCVHAAGTLPAILERWQNSIATGTPFEMVFPLLGADGVPALSDSRRAGTGRERPHRQLVRDEYRNWRTAANRKVALR
jgi:CHASE3 domain sensor protein